MYSTVTRATHIAGLLYAVVMTVAVHGAVLVIFNGAATDAYVAQSSHTSKVAVLDKVTIVGHRI